MTDLLFNRGEDDFLVFRGASNQEAEDFVRAVRIQAFKSGKFKDQEWITELAAAAFAGNALRWYLRLPNSTREDWDKLQGAILEHQWADESGVSSATIPAAAPVSAAGPPSSSILPPGPAQPVRLPASRSPRTARIRIRSDDQSLNGYLALETFRPEQGEPELGMFFDPDKSKAARVRYDPSHFPTKLELLDVAGSNTFVCGQFFEQAGPTCEFGPGKKGRIFLIPIMYHPETGPLILKQNGRPQGDAFSDIWGVYEDQSLVAVFAQSGCPYNLIPIVFKPMDLVGLCSDPAAIQASFTDNVVVKAASLFPKPSPIYLRHANTDPRGNPIIETPTGS
ncbi:hypothetical protein FRC05_010762 [Tulasnella sp. 425]|nr:hypothetical protein FRC05_010762 [Tulasnella sp. 425]